VNATPALLVADDDQVARELLAEVLGREGYRVRIAGGGAECLRLAEAEPFDVALVDIQLEDGDRSCPGRRVGARRIVALLRWSRRYLAAHPTQQRSSWIAKSGRGHRVDFPTGPNG